MWKTIWYEMVSILIFLLALQQVALEEVGHLNQSI